ncbi:hypothetical protein [Candidatus Corynebacterium faecigallinarum]|uniref:hypothetical protein n=1 Tax=Candidatus Corynebacterium faecigallinarum TaxID=2838528 RepID=UPI003FD693B3
MSIPRPRYKRTHAAHATTESAPAGEEVPVVLPQVVMIVGDDGAMTVTVDGTPYEPEEFAPPWRRESFPVILDTLTGQRRAPVRVEVHESDGSTFTDIVTPRPPTRAPAETTPQPAATQDAGARLVEVAGEGFVPGEDVAVAVIVRHASATATGTARHLLDQAELGPDGRGEVLLFGRISGTAVIVGGLP